MDPDHNYSSTSELESDSDWLDIASSRASEDGDSLAGFDDSDREDADGRPLSRRSFTSVASSSDDVVEGWEGLIDDSADETPLPRSDGLADHMSIVDGAPYDRAASPEEEEDPEEERVKAGLEQSMMSTLSSSRSNSLSNSLQTSIVHSTRSLRLSFPDPTTSRLESLTTSYEELSATEAEPRDSTEDDKPERLSDQLTAGPVSQDAPAPTTSPLAADFSVVLYGSPAASQVRSVDVLLEKWAISSGLIAKKKISCDSCTVLNTFRSLDGDIKRTVSVVDKTRIEHSLPSNIRSPSSLAVVFLPSTSLFALPEHALYLPVVVPDPVSPIDLAGTTDYLLEAEQQWEGLAIPSAKLTGFSRHSAPVVDQDRLEDATCEQVQHALRGLSRPTSTKAVIPKVSAHAFTILAILSIVLGYIVKGSMPPTFVNRAVVSMFGSDTPRHAVIMGNTSHLNIVVPSVSHSVMEVSSSKALDVSVLNPAPPSAAQASTSAGHSEASSSSSAIAVRPPMEVQGPAECQCGCGLLTWPAKTEATDLVVRPTSSAPSVVANTITSISVVPSHIPHTIKGKGKATEDASVYALSTRMANSLSEFLSFNFHPVMRAAAADIQELLDAIDALAQTISRQTSVLWDQSRDAVSVLKSTFEQRHEIAKNKARHMRAVGEQWFSSLKEHIRGRAEIARENARALKDRRMKRRGDRRVRRSERAEMRAERHAARV